MLLYRTEVLRSALISNTGNDALVTTAIPTFHHNLSCDECARDAEGNRMQKESLVDKTLPRND